MRAFLGSAEVKDKVLTRVRAHREADQLIKGTYWEDGKGCAIGCTVHSENHAAYESQLGIPRLLARLEDGIFESLPNGSAMLWPEKFLSAIPVGADLSGVWPRFAVWMLIDPKWGVLQFATTKRTKKIIQDVADAYQSIVESASANADWYSLTTTARWDAVAAAAARWAADGTADTAARWAADAAAADDAVDASAAAASAASAASAADAARWRSAQADKLIELLAAAPVPELAEKN